jgi:hypothetical protein
MKSDFMTIKKYTCGTALALLLLTSACAMAADSTPPLATIIQQVIARDDANQKELQSMEFHETLKTEQLAADGHVTKQQEVKMILRPGATDEVTVLSAKGDDLPTDPDAAARKAKGEQAKTKSMRFALKDMSDRFIIALAGTNVFRGQPVYVLTFEPKPNQSYRDQTEKVLNQLHGRMWISTADYSVLKTDATLAHPVDVAWFLAQITSLDFHYELRGGPGAMGPAFIQTSVVVDAPFVTIRQKMSYDMTDFASRVGAVAGE